MRVLLLPLLLLACVNVARAEEPDPNPVEWLSTKRDHIELMLGAGVEMPLTNAAHDERHREFLVVSPRWGLFATDLAAPPFGGSLEVLAQVNFFEQLHPYPRY